MNEQTIWQYLDGQLSVNERRKFEHLLDKDSDLRSTYEQLKQFNHLLEEKNLVVAPEGFARKVTQSIKQPKFKFSINGILPYWIGFLIVNLLTIIINNGEGLLPDVAFLNPEQQGNWMPFFNLLGTICIGLTLLYFLDKFLRKQIISRTNFSAI